MTTITTIRKAISSELDTLSLTWDDITTLGVATEKLDEDLSSLNRLDVVAWTEVHILVVDHYWDDGVEVTSIPRVPATDFESIAAYVAPAPRDPNAPPPTYVISGLMARLHKSDGTFEDFGEIPELMFIVGGEPSETRKHNATPSPFMIIDEVDDAGWDVEQANPKIAALMARGKAQGWTK